MEIEILKCAGEVADQCRALGLQVGDTIIGREEGDGCWHEAELTLLWMGEEAAVFRERTRCNTRPEWSEPREAGDWTLEWRDWRKTPNVLLTTPSKTQSGTD